MGEGSSDFGPVLYLEEDDTTRGCSTFCSVGLFSNLNRMKSYHHVFETVIMVIWAQTLWKDLNR